MVMVAILRRFLMTPPALLKNTGIDFAVTRLMATQNDAVRFTFTMLLVCRETFFAIGYLTTTRTNEQKMAMCHCSLSGRSGHA